MATGLPKGYEQYSLPAMGSDQKGVYDLFRNQFQSGGGTDVLKQLFSMAQGKGDIFNQLEVPARRELNANLANIGSQFGLSGTNKSSGFQNAIAGAGQNFQEGLYGKRADLMQKSMSDVLSLGEKLLGMPTEYYGLAKQPQGFDFSKLFQQAGATGGDILQNIIGKPSKNSSGVEGIDWGSIASSFTKFAPLLLGLL